MIPRILIDTAQIPGGGELRLIQRGDEFSIMLGGNELMNSRVSGSEEALAALTAERLRDRPEARVLIGGLGMGFTLRAALEAFGVKSSFVVAELVPGVIAWAKGPLAHILGPSLGHCRVQVVQGDVADLIGAGSASYDAILLDVDNGPDGITSAANDRLYGKQGLSRASAALRPGGVLAIWSSAPDDAFSQRLRGAGFAVEEVAVRARGDRGPRHLIWIATRR